MHLSTFISSCFLFISLQTYAETPDIVPFLSDTSSVNTVYRMVTGDETDIVTTRFIRPSIEIWNYPKLTSSDKRQIKKVINRFGRKYFNGIYGIYAMVAGFNSEADIYRKLLNALVDPYIDSGLLTEMEQAKLKDLKWKIDRLNDKEFVEMISRSVSYYNKTVSDESCNYFRQGDFSEYGDCTSIHLVFGTGNGLIPNSSDLSSKSLSFKKNYGFVIKLEIIGIPKTNKRSGGDKNTMEYFVIPDFYYNCSEELKNNWKTTIFTIFELMPEFEGSVRMGGDDEGDDKIVAMKVNQEFIEIEPVSYYNLESGNEFIGKRSDGVCALIMPEEH